MARMRLAPDLGSPLFPDQLQRDGAHRRDRGELDEPVGVGVPQLRRHASDRLEARHKEAAGAFATGVVRHAGIFAAAPDGPAAPWLVPGT